jgi:hypothetical protein
MSEFHGWAPAGTFVEVVVCIPFTHCQMIMSPTWALIIRGPNLKSATLTRILAADAADAPHNINASEARRAFFMMFGVFIFFNFLSFSASTRLHARTNPLRAPVKVCVNHKRA